MNRSRVPIVVVLILALFATGLTRYFATERRNAGRRFGTGTDASGGARLSGMDSFALALLLGGLRGPLVMILWANSESQKSEKNLEGVDTMIEWIRLLQPEFDTVHIFQGWNKAYNISVQMASHSNKYLTIIDAIDYEQKVDDERPDNINILYMIGSIYGDKLGDSAEKAYYTKRVRDESLPHPARQKLARNDPGYRRLELDPVLDANGNVLAQFLKPSGVNLVDPTNPQDKYDGSELPFLTRFQPYKYGVAPHGFAYNYRKRAQLLQRLADQNHAQLSELVVDSRPALDLKKWAEVEWEQALRLEIVAMGKPAPAAAAERHEMEEPTADVAPDASIDPGRLATIDQAIFGYDLGARLSSASDVEYAEHLKRFKTNFEQYESHRAELQAQLALISADRDYLKAMTGEGAADEQAKKKLLESAKEQYRRAQVRYGLIILRYYTPDPVATEIFPPTVTRQNFATTWGAEPDKRTPEEVVPMLHKLFQVSQASQIPLQDEVNEYINYIKRAEARLKHIQ